MHVRYSSDDALGEAYDKTARLLGLNVGGGGGPALEALAKNGDATAYKFPVPLRQRKNCDFSYAGLKTAGTFRSTLIITRSFLSFSHSPT